MKKSKQNPLRPLVGEAEHESSLARPAPLEKPWAIMGISRREYDRIKPWKQGSGEQWNKKPA